MLVSGRVGLRAIEADVACSPVALEAVSDRSLPMLCQHYIDWIVYIDDVAHF